MLHRAKTEALDIFSSEKSYAVFCILFSENKVFNSALKTGRRKRFFFDTEKGGSLKTAASKVIKA